MIFWKGLWTIVWFGGVGIFIVLTGLVIVHGWRDIRSMLRALAQPPRPAPAESRVELD